MDKGLEELKERIQRLESRVFSMTAEEAKELVDGYLEAAEANPKVEPNEWVLKAEKMLGI